MVTPYIGHDTAVAIQQVFQGHLYSNYLLHQCPNEQSLHTSISGGQAIKGRGNRLHERVLREVFGWAGVSHKNKSIRAFQGLVSPIPCRPGLCWVRLGNEGLGTSFDIFPAYASSSWSKALLLLYVFRFHFPLNWPDPKEKRCIREERRR